MITYEKFTLPNGLRLLVNVDKHSPIAAINTLYDVGARDEVPGKTGFAHLFEHLMFGGSLHIPSFDTPLQKVGGKNNAFTNNDFTNYYITLPVDNIETAYWLESDRMLSLAFTPESLEVQRKVVVEEFRQNYLNQPYGDFWLNFRPLAYQKHPYQWATIGQEVAHIENATMDDVKSFYQDFYHPGNAVMAVSGNVDPQQVLERVMYWFGDIEGKSPKPRQLPEEPRQNKSRQMTLIRNVPQNALHMAWHMPGRMDPDYHAADLITDVLGQGNSSRLQKILVKEKQLFTSFNLYVLGSRDPGLMVASGMLVAGVEHQEGKDAILTAILEFLEKGPEARELERVKNRYEMNHVLPELTVLSKAMNLAYYEWLGDVDAVNRVVDDYRSVTTEDVLRVGRSIFRPENLSELRYQMSEKK